ncbi:MAG: FecR domain-containing protein, partial [SAR324 cluster bacterium]|nr:FecR domain-containing protein [SAR324 cluster bacterium]
RVSLKFKNGTENIDLFSHAFFAVEGVSEEQRNVALLVGKGNFALPPASEQEEEAETSEAEEKPISEEMELNNSAKSSSEAEESQKEEVTETNKTRKTVLQSDKSNSDEMKKASPARTQKKIARSSKRKQGGLLARKKRFRVRTVSAVVGVRGTEFVVAATEDSTNVLTVTGEVTLASVELPEYEITLPKSSVSKVTEGRTPSQPVSVPILEQQQIMDSASIEGFQEVEFGPTQAVEAIQEGQEIQPTGEVGLGTGEEVNILEQLETLDSVQQIVDSAEEAINLSQTRMFILKTNIIPR